MVTTVGSEVIVNADLAGTQARESIVRLSNGTYVVCWNDQQDGSLKFRLLSAGGTPLGSVDTSVTGALYDLNISSKMISLADGSFVIAWSQYEGTGNNSGEVYARRYSATGVALSAITTLNATSDGAQTLRDIVATSDGGFAVSYMHDLNTGAGPGERTEFLRFFSADMVGGAAVPAGWRMQADIYLNGKTPLTNKSDFQFSYPDGSLWTIQKTNYATDGTYSTQNFSTNVVYEPSRSNLTLWEISSDTLLATWAVVDFAVSPWTNIAKAQLLRLVNGSYQALGSVFTVNQEGDYDYNLSVAAGPNRTFVISWGDEDSNVHAQVYQAEAPAALPTIALESATKVLLEGEQRKIAVTLSATATQTVTFNYAFIDGTATYGSDLTSGAKVGQITIAAGSNVAYIPLNAVQDLLAEGTETLKLRLISASGATLGTTTETTISIQNRTLGATADSLFATNGKLVVLATLAEAAYVWGQTEEDKPSLSPQLQAAWTSAWQWLTPLSAAEIPDLTLRYSLATHWTNNGLDTGIYHNQNSGALIGRSRDALFVAFRGTDDAADRGDWLNRHLHYDLFSELITEISDYVIASRTSGAPVNKVYLTGHSLGAAMVAPALEVIQAALDAQLGTDTVIVEGVTFANPGARLGMDTDSNRIANFWNGADIIKIASALSWVEGDQYKLNSAANDILFSNLFSGVPASEWATRFHSMELYRAAMQFLFTEGKAHGLDIDLAGLDFNLRGYQIERIDYRIQHLGGNSFALGTQAEIIFPGLIEAVETTIKAMTVDWAIGLSDIVDTCKTTLTGLLEIDALFNGFNLSSLAGLGDALVNLVGKLPNYEKALKGALDLLKAGTLVINAVETYNASDLVVGGAGNDILFGLGGNDVMLGGLGDDELWGGAGNDDLYGGAGNDYIVADSGNDRLFGGVGNDKLVVQAANQYAIEKENEGLDTVYSFVSYDLSGTQQRYIERLVLAGIGSHTAIGNDGNNTITGNGSANRMEGRGGADLLYGHGGNDLIYGGSGIDSILGEAGDDTIDGGSEADRMLGGKGNDTFYVDNVGDIVMENVGEGTDRIITTYGLTLQLNAEIEAVQLASPTSTAAANLRGNPFNQTLTGNNGVNSLDGMGGNDTLVGLGGNDIFYVDSKTDVVTEVAGGGYDTVYATTSYTLRAGADVEVLSAFPVASTTGLTLIGNEIGQQIIGTAGNDYLYGYGGKDRLVGAGGKDTLEGGADDDLYFVIDPNAVIVERSSEGSSDQIYSSVNFTLGSTCYVEVLRTDNQAGTGKINLTGNDLGNQVIGNEGVNILAGAKGNDTLFGYGGNDNLQGGDNDDWLFGGAGNDTMFGGSGTDRFAFDTAVNAANNVDFIADFDVALDFLHLKQTVFSGVTSRGTLAADAFYIGAAAHDASDRIIYDATSGVLYYDPDGTGSIGAQQFATLGRNLALTNADFVIY